MKTAFTGCSSTGKTTLALAACARRPSTQFLPGNSRTILDELGVDLLTASAHDRRRFQREYLRQKVERELGQEDFIVDRSFVDVAAYWICYGLSAGGDDRFLNECRRLALGYDQHVYFRPGLIPFAWDGYRQGDQALRTKVDDTIRRLLDDWGIVAIPICSVTVDERLAEVLGMLGGDDE